eukprot:4705023-Amphidinium_carterae.2
MQHRRHIHKGLRWTLMSVDRVAAAWAPPTHGYLRRAGWNGVSSTASGASAQPQRPTSAAAIWDEPVSGGQRTHRDGKE